MDRNLSRILNKISEVLTDDELKMLEDRIETLDFQSVDYANYGKPLTSEEKNSLVELKKAVKQSDVDKKKSGFTELSYLSWSVITEALNTYLGFNNWKISSLNKECLSEINGYYQIEVTLNIFQGKIVTTQTLPVMDGANMPVKAEAYSYTTKKGEKRTVEALDSFNANKNWQRAFVKAVAVATNLGIEMFKGEDLPEESDVDNSDVNNDSNAKNSSKNVSKKNNRNTKSSSKKEETSTDEEEPF